MLRAAPRSPIKELSIRFPNLTPPANAIIHKVIPVNAAVLKFGCLRINKICIRKKQIIFTFNENLMYFQYAKKFAATRIENGFISSEGWICIDPRMSHLEDPLIVVPKNDVDAIKIKKTRKILKETFNHVLTFVWRTKEKHKRLGINHKIWRFK